MSTDPVDPSQGAYGVGGTDPIDDGSSAYLTPEALLAYCQSRMRNIDDQVNGIAAQQQKSDTEIQQLHDLQGVLSPCVTTGITDDATFNKVVGTKDSTDPNTFGYKLTQLEKQYPELTPTLEKDWQTLNTDGKGGTDKQISAPEISQVIQDVSGMVNDVNSGAELNMIQLQSLMSQRQTAIQLTTNLIQSMDDTSKAIAQNVGK